MTKQEWATRRTILRNTFLALEHDLRRRSTVDGVRALRSALTAVLHSTDAHHPSYGYAWDDLRELDSTVANAWSRWVKTMGSADLGVLDVDGVS